MFELCVVFCGELEVVEVTIEGAVSNVASSPADGEGTTIIWRACVECTN